MNGVTKAMIGNINAHCQHLTVATRSPRIRLGDRQMRDSTMFYSVVSIHVRIYIYIYILKL